MLDVATEGFAAGVADDVADGEPVEDAVGVTADGAIPANTVGRVSIDQAFPSEDESTVVPTLPLTKTRNRSLVAITGPRVSSAAPPATIGEGPPRSEIEKGGVGVTAMTGSGEPRVTSPVRTASEPRESTPARTSPLPNGDSLPRVSAEAPVVIGFQVMPSSEVQSEAGFAGDAELPGDGGAPRTLSGSEEMATKESKTCVTDSRATD